MNEFDFLTSHPCFLTTSETPTAFAYSFKKNTDVYTLFIQKYFNDQGLGVYLEIPKRMNYDDMIQSAPWFYRLAQEAQKVYNEKYRLFDLF